MFLLILKITLCNQSYQIFIVKNRITDKPYGIVILDIKEQRCDIVDIISPLKNTFCHNFNPTPM